MSTEENKALAHRVIEAFNQRNLNLLDELYVEDYIHHDANLPPEAQRGRENYKQGVAMFYAAFPDLQGIVEDLVAEGDKVVARLRWQGTHQGELLGIPPTGNAVEFSMMEILRMADGRVAEGWVVFDALGMMQQLGVIPQPE